MSIEVSLNRIIPPDATDALRAAINTAIGAGKYNGIVGRKGNNWMLFENSVSVEDQNTALQLALGFDINLRTPEQIEHATETANLQSLLDQADAAVAAIGSELTAIAADGAALTAAGTLGAVKPIVQNMLDRQQSMDTRQRVIIRALKRMRLLVFSSAIPSQSDR